MSSTGVLNAVDSYYMLQGEMPLKIVMSWRMWRKILSDLKAEGGESLWDGQKNTMAGISLVLDDSVGDSILAMR